MAWMCSADSHFTEPGDLWVSRMPAGLRADAPRYDVRNGLLALQAFGKEFMKLPAGGMLDFNAVPDDVPARLAMLDAENIWAEVLIGNLAGLFVLSFEDPEFAMASARAYNDYVAETFGPYRDRQVAVAMLPVRDIGLAVEEIDRAAKLGLAGVTLPLEPHEPYFLEKYEPVWAAAAANRMPVSFHATTGGDFTQKFSPENAAAHFGGDERTRHARKTLFALKFGVDAHTVTAHLIGAGVLERYPDLHFMFVEATAGWLAGAMAAMDAEWAVRPAQERAEGTMAYSPGPDGEVAMNSMSLMGGGWPYPLTPSEYVRRQIHATFQSEQAPLKFRKFTGVAPLLWGSDFPHPEGTWPHTDKVIKELFSDIEVADREAILGGTVASIYGISVPTS